MDDTAPCNNMHGMSTESTRMNTVDDTAPCNSNGVSIYSWWQLCRESSTREMAADSYGGALPQRTAIVSGWKCADVRGTQGVMEMLLSLLLSTAAGNFTEKHRQQQRR